MVAGLEASSQKSSDGRLVPPSDDSTRRRSGHLHHTTLACLVVFIRNLITIQVSETVPEMLEASHKPPSVRIDIATV